MRKPASKLVVTRDFGCIPEVLFNSFANFPALNLGQTPILLYILYIQNFGVSFLNASAASVELFTTSLYVTVMVLLKAVGNAKVQLKNIIQSPMVHRYDKELFFVFWGFW